MALEVAVDYDSAIACVEKFNSNGGVVAEIKRTDYFNRGEIVYIDKTTRSEPIRRELTICGIYVPPKKLLFWTSKAKIQLIPQHEQSRLRECLTQKIRPDEHKRRPTRISFWGSLSDTG